MKRSSLGTLFQLSLFTVWLSSGVAARPTEPVAALFVPDLDRAGELTLEGATWARKATDHTVLLRPLDDRERLRYIENRTGVAVDPFSTPPGRQPRYLTYLLVIENRGDSEVGFNALDCWLKTNRDEIRTPVGLTDLSFDYQLAGLTLPAAYERIATALLEGGRIVRPGETISGLLVYHVTHPRTKRFRIEVDLIPSSGEVIRFSAPYRKDGDSGKGSTAARGETGAGGEER
ncbi:MAG TPA: hypothetical protein VD788_01000 [Candidatus Polarisedimenticolaceae bacterium]|nr:hypothetical protein [Candidatus Polarisedimenticolaceae bacterium]